MKCIRAQCVGARIWVTLALALYLHAQATPTSSPPRIKMSEAEMESRLIDGGEINYPAIPRATHIEGHVVLDAIIGTNGSVLGLQAVSGDPYLVRAALEGVSKWHYRPVSQNGIPVEVETTITVRFKLDEQAQTGRSSTFASMSSGPVTIEDTQATSPETIHLLNGRVIHADTVTDDGQKIEYTQGDSVFEIPKSLVKSVVKAPGATAFSASSTTWQSSNSESATVTGAPLTRIPIKFGDDPKNWYPYESTEQLRQECRSGDFYNRFHPEIQSADLFPNKDDAERICAILSAEADSEYEALINHGVELQHTLCPVVNGRLSKVRSADPKVLAMQQEMGRISAEFIKRMNDFVQNPRGARGPGLRLLLDINRLGCGGY